MPLKHCKNKKRNMSYINHHLQQQSVLCKNKQMSERNHSVNFCWEGMHGEFSLPVWVSLPEEHSRAFLGHCSCWAMAPILRIWKCNLSSWVNTSLLEHMKTHRKCSWAGWRHGLRENCCLLVYSFKDLGKVKHEKKKTKNEMPAKAHQTHTPWMNI